MSAVESLTPAGVASIARAIYSDGPILYRSMQYWRPYICPFDRVIAEIPLGSLVLDVGCGGGLLLGAAARLGRIAGGTGFDFSKQAISVANTMANSLGGRHGLDFRHLSVTDVWPQGPFTLVTMIDVLHHVPIVAQQEVFRKAAQAVRSGARLLYKDIAPHPRWRAAANTLHDLVMARQLVNYVPMATITTWARAEGLQLEREFQLNRLWYGHQFAIFSRAG